MLPSAQTQNLTYAQLQNIPIYYSQNKDWKAPEGITVYTPDTGINPDASYRMKDGTIITGAELLNKSVRQNIIDYQSRVQSSLAPGETPNFDKNGNLILITSMAMGGKNIPVGQYNEALRAAGSYQRAFTTANPGEQLKLLQNSESLYNSFVKTMTEQGIPIIYGKVLTSFGKPVIEGFTRTMATPRTLSGYDIADVAFGGKLPDFNIGSMKFGVTPQEATTAAAGAIVSYYKTKDVFGFA